MKSARVSVVVLAGLAAVALGASCTLILDTEGLIKNCVSQDDCDPGFVCERDACLPEDDGSGGGEEETG
jgi:hypothetical protein